MKKFIFLFTLASFCTAVKPYAQPQKIVADKIVAQVGDKIILQSDIINAIADYRRQGQEAQLPPQPECAFLEGQLIQKALVLQADKDSLTVSDDELDALLDNQIRYFIQQYGSQDVLEQIYGKSIYQMKEDFRQPFKERKLADQMRSKILDNVKITPTEARLYFEKIPKDSLPFFESELEVNELIIYPDANKDVEEYITNQLNDIKRQVESGAKKFADMAKLISQDPGSKDNGGQYSINRNDKQWDPAFLAAAFKLKEGQISPVIKSKFGLHIIQMVSRAGDDAVIRHILLIPSVTDIEINQAKSILDSARHLILTGALNFGSAVNKYSNDDNSKTVAGQIFSPDGSAFVTIDQLDKDIVVALKNMNVGDISQPVVFTNDRGKTGVRIVYLKTRTEPHRLNLKDDYNKISQMALDDKKSEVLQKWFKEHIPSYYIWIDKSFSGCSNISEWFLAAANSSK